MTKEFKTLEALIKYVYRHMNKKKGYKYICKHGRYQGPFGYSIKEINVITQKRAQ